MVGRMVSRRQTRCWRGGWEFYIQIGKHQEERVDTRPNLGFWDLKTHPQWHTTFHKATPTLTRSHLLIVPHSLWVYERYFHPNHHREASLIKAKSHCYIKEKYQQRSPGHKIFFEKRLQMKELFQNKQSDWVENLSGNERHSGRARNLFFTSDISEHNLSDDNCSTLATHNKRKLWSYSHYTNKGQQGVQIFTLTGECVALLFPLGRDS